GGPAWGLLGSRPSGFAGTPSPPGGGASAAGGALLARHFPQSSANPTSLIFRFAGPVWQHPATLAAGTRQLQASGLSTTVTGPLNPTGAPLPPAVFAALHARLGPASALPPIPPSGTGVPLPAYEAYRATANYVSPDGRTVQYSAGLRPGDPGGPPALRAVPGIPAPPPPLAPSTGAH